MLLGLRLLVIMEDEMIFRFFARGFRGWGKNLERFLLYAISFFLLLLFGRICLEIVRLTENFREANGFIGGTSVISMEYSLTNWLLATMLLLAVTYEVRKGNPDLFKK